MVPGLALIRINIVSMLAPGAIRLWPFAQQTGSAARPLS